MTTPNEKLVEILRPAYRCCSFDDACRGTATWKPNFGYVPRGFVGASGSLDEVKVIILSDRPGSPFSQEQYSAPNELEQTIDFTFQCLSNRTPPFHENLGYLLDRIFPNEGLEDQLKKTWVTNSYLCSFPEYVDDAPSKAWHECADRYLSSQLAILPGRPVIALGTTVGKRARRAGVDKNLLYEAHALRQRSPSRERNARRTWEEAARWARDVLASRLEDRDSR